MKLINLEKIKFPSSPENATAYKKLEKHRGKKVVIVFRQRQPSRRGKITRHHCVINSLWERGIQFSPPIRIPRGKYADLLIISTFLVDLKHIEIKDPQ